MKPENSFLFFEFYDMKWAKQGNDKRDYYTRMVMQIVGFNIKVNKITAKYKLGLP